MPKKETTEQTLGEDQLVCALTGLFKKATDKEMNLQSVIVMLNEEYGFDLRDMERDWTLFLQDEEGRKKRIKLDLAIFDQDSDHVPANLIRACIVHDGKVKADDRKKGVEATLEPILTHTECEFGLWSNGDEYHFEQAEEDHFGNREAIDISDFPSQGQTMQELENAGDRVQPRKPANDSLIRTFKRCHDYIYANEGMKKTAFWELLNLIFCKIYDEKRRFSMPRGETYRRRFWVGVKEKNTPTGLKAIRSRIVSLFDELKNDKLFAEVFDGNERINLSERGLAFVAGELAKYSFLDATVDVKGTAYETIVSNTLKQEAGQFFTPRNAIRCMVEMMDPNERTRVLDPACGSGGFLVMVLDHVRRKIAKELYPDADDVMLQIKCNSREVIERVRKYAASMLFGFDFDSDLKKAARMNMVMAGDGHANIFNINSLEYPKGDKPDIAKIGSRILSSIQIAQDKDSCEGRGTDARGKFDMVFTNPPFGTKVKVDLAISRNFELGKTRKKEADGSFTTSEPSSGEAPEVLFIEKCGEFLKPGGKLAIVLPDGILGNPDAEAIRLWILQNFRILASIDLPVEMFLPQVGVQASLFFLQKKTEEERLASANGNEDYEVFMAIAEAVGKDRRGQPIYKRDDDGAEILVEDVKRIPVLQPDGSTKIITKRIKAKHLDDDLPEIALAYAKFLKKGKRR
jgi:type I restriction enzyme M protein